jgi:hypothetical protein
MCVRRWSRGNASLLQLRKLKIIKACGAADSRIVNE